MIDSFFRMVLFATAIVIITIIAISNLKVLVWAIGIVVGIVIFAFVLMFFVGMVLYIKKRLLISEFLRQNPMETTHLSLRTKHVLRRSISSFERRVLNQLKAEPQYNPHHRIEEINPIQNPSLYKKKAKLIEIYEIQRLLFKEEMTSEDILRIQSFFQKK